MPALEIRTLSTAEIDVADARGLLERAFDEEVREEDWEHCVGGVHVLAFADSALVGHGALVARQLTHRGRRIRTGYVEGLAVDQHFRRRGTAAAIMREIERRIRSGFELGALSSSDEALGFYAHRGWVRWRGETAVLAQDGNVVRTPDDDDSVFVLPVDAEVDPSGLLVCDWRLGDVW